MNKINKRIKYGNLNKIPTTRIRAILDEPFNRGVNGKDYGPVIEELEAIFWAREGARLVAEEVKLLKAAERFEAKLAAELPQEAQESPELPQEAQEAQEAQEMEATAPESPELRQNDVLPALPLIRVIEYQNELVESFREFWKLGEKDFLEIPPAILEF